MHILWTVFSRYATTSKRGRGGGGRALIDLCNLCKCKTPLDTFLCAGKRTKNMAQKKNWSDGCLMADYWNGEWLLSLEAGIYPTEHNTSLKWYAARHISLLFLLQKSHQPVLSHHNVYCTVHTKPKFHQKVWSCVPNRMCMWPEYGTAKYFITLFSQNWELRAKHRRTNYIFVPESVCMPIENNQIRCVSFVSLLSLYVPVYIIQNIFGASKAKWKKKERKK